jgi:hypothetical protein
LKNTANHLQILQNLWGKMMNDIQIVIAIQFFLIITLFIIVIRQDKQLQKFNEWADTVDEFMDSEYIELEFEVKDDKNKKSKN